MPTPRRSLTLAMPVGTLCALAACTASPHSVEGTAALPLSPCHVGRLAEEVRCGVLRTSEDRHARAGRTIDVHVAVLPALRRVAAPDPLLVFAGGPGQGARDFAEAADRHFRKIRRTRDIVLIDLRGTGASHPLRCEVPQDELAAVTDVGWFEEHVAECAATLDADPRHYTHAASLADVDEIRQRLGYARVNLWGGSWGTRAALLYALRYPEHVRSVVLDGAVPLAMEFPRSASRDAQRALDLLVAQCRADAACLARFPDPADEIAALVRRLDEGPLSARPRHPRTGEPTEVSLVATAVLDTLRGALYVPQDAVGLLHIARQAREGHVGPLLAQAVRTASVTTDDMALGATLSVLCSEDVPATWGVDFTGDAAGSLFGTGYAEAWRTRCGAWPAGPALDVARDATSSAPALILSGAHDPVTPPRWGERMGEHFPRHRHIEVAAAAHNASFTGCMPDLIAAFVAAGAADALETACLERAAWPDLVLGPEGPRP